MKPVEMAKTEDKIPSSTATRISHLRIVLLVKHHTLRCNDNRSRLPRGGMVDQPSHI